MNNAQNNPKTAQWQALSQAHHLAPFSDYKQLAEKGGDFYKTLGGGVWMAPAMLRR